MPITEAERIASVLAERFHSHMRQFVPMILDHFKTSWELMHLGERLQAVKVPRFRHQTADSILWGTAARGTKTYRAVLYLCALGYGPQATVLNRTLIEDALTARWAEMNREEAQRRVEDHEKHNLHLWRAVLSNRKSKPDLGPLADLEPLTDEERKALAKDFGEYGDKPWTGHAIWRLMDVMTEHWGDERQQLLLDHMRIHLRHCNQTVHNTATSLTKPNSLDADSVVFDAGESADQIAVALIAGFWAYGNLFRVVLLGDQRAEFEAFYVEKMATFFGPYSGIDAIE